MEVSIFNCVLKAKQIMDLIKTLAFLLITSVFSGCASTESTSDEVGAKAEYDPSEAQPTKTLMDLYISGDIPEDPN